MRRILNIAVLSEQPTDWWREFFSGTHHITTDSLVTIEVDDALVNLFPVHSIHVTSPTAAYACDHADGVIFVSSLSYNSMRVLDGWRQQVGKVRAASVPYFFAVDRREPTRDVDRAVDAQNLEERGFDKANVVYRDDGDLAAVAQDALRKIVELTQ